MSAEARPEDAGRALAAIRRRGFLGSLPTDLAERIVSRAVMLRHAAASTPLQAPGPAVVVSGMVRYFMTASDGRQLTIRYVGEGDLVGTVFPSPVFGVSTGFQTLAPSSLLYLDGAQLLACARERPELGLALAREYSHRLRHAHRALASSVFATVRARLARDLVERAKAAGARGPAVRLSVTQQELADATGSVREVVARALAELRHLGLLTTDHSTVVIPDLRALAREVGLGDPAAA
jgi:CRP/FNR family cyclic AMP-dependent transcriptional regulator